jgi:hypothetical protein
VSALETIRDQLLRYDPTVGILNHWISEQATAGVYQPIVLEPSAIARYLPYIYLLERLGDRLRYRVSGEEVNRLFGSNHGGKFLDEVVPQGAYALIRPYFFGVFKPTVCIFKGRVTLPDKEFLEFERLLLPVLHRDRLHLLGCLSLSSTSRPREDGLVIDPVGPGLNFTVFDLATRTVERSRIDYVPSVSPA